MAGEGAGRAEGVQAVGRQFVGGHVVAQVAVLNGLRDQSLDEAAKSLLGVVDVLAAGAAPYTPFNTETKCR